MNGGGGVEGEGGGCVLFHVMVPLIFDEATDVRGRRRRGPWFYQLFLLHSSFPHRYSV